uniref:Chromosome 18 open reading frame 21 n=1 Tax=Sphenodon punctatus TaxID=8508 RepID=A0A8D0H412_SPHPU
MKGRGWLLDTAARELMDACPGQARFLLWTLHSLQDDKTTNARKMCTYCFQLLDPNNHRVRLKPKMKVTPQIQRLLNRESKNHKLNLTQTKLLRKYKNSRSVLLITCNTCNKTTRRYGKSRDFLATVTKRFSTSGLKTPTSSNKERPNSHSNSGSKGKNPSSNSRACKSGQSTPGSSSKTPKNAKFHFSQLKRLFDLEEKQKSQKGDLKDFLSSL